jgi:hypothetical protein
MYPKAILSQRKTCYRICELLHRILEGAGVEMEDLYSAK